MNAKDRERLALSTGLALAGYAVVFLLLAGLDWPSVAPFHSISPPVSVYVNLSGSGTALALNSGIAKAKAAESPATVSRAAEAKTPTEQPAGAKQAPTGEPAKPAAPETTLASQPAVATPPQPPVQPSSASPPMPTTQEATVIPPPVSAGARSEGATKRSVAQPPMPTTQTSTAGPLQPGVMSPTPSTAVGKPAPAVSGSPSPTPGVTYPPNTQTAAAPPSGSGGAGASDLTGHSQTYFGPSPSGSGEFFNNQLAQAAGRSSATAPPASAGSGAPSESASGSPSSSVPASGAASGAANGTAGQSAGATSAPAGGGPTIVWKDSSSTRRVVFEPKPLVIPKKYLDEIPPTITLTINFQVMPPGTVNALNITPSLGYPELDNLLESWMEEWRFQSVSGDQVAQGKLEYVIQAVTAR